MDMLLIFLAVFGLSFFIAYIYTARQLKITTKNLAESVLLYIALRESLETPSGFAPDNEKVHSDNFIKFLSDSRDWAYDYIESVQKNLSEFISEVEPSIRFFKEYGLVVEGSPHYNDMKIIAENFDKIKSLLPEDIDDRR